MEIKSYSELYVSDVSENIGSMLEYAQKCGLSVDAFWKSFINSTVAKQIENGNLNFLSGYSGIDYLNIVAKEKQLVKFFDNDKLNCTDQLLSFNEYYWAGWAIAQLQYHTGFSFCDIEEYLTLEKVIEMHSTLHEADISKFIDVAKTFLINGKRETNLKKIRMASGMSQQKLADLSLVDIRSIQMYEQKKNDINKAQSQTLLKISKVLGCKIEDLLENNCD